jgi:hypothetical protein
MAKIVGCVGCKYDEDLDERSDALVPRELKDGTVLGG